MKCYEHADRDAVYRCDGCAEPFCEECVVYVGGARYCASCKVLATSDRIQLRKGFSQESIVATIAACLSPLSFFIGFYGGIACLVAIGAGVGAFKKSAEEGEDGWGLGIAAMISGTAVGLLLLVAMARS
ncbi:hypothetical protein ACFLQU_04950 [Verrucomicrobiota bacterium]